MCDASEITDAIEKAFNATPNKRKTYEEKISEFRNILQYVKDNLSKEAELKKKFCARYDIWSSWDFLAERLTNVLTKWDNDVEFKKWYLKRDDESDNNLVLNVFSEINCILMMDGATHRIILNELKLTK